MLLQSVVQRAATASSARRYIIKITVHQGQDKLHRLVNGVLLSYPKDSPRVRPGVTRLVSGSSTIFLEISHRKVSHVYSNCDSKDRCRSCTSRTRIWYSSHCFIIIYADSGKYLKTFIVTRVIWQLFTFFIRIILKEQMTCWLFIARIRHR